MSHIRAASVFFLCGSAALYFLAASPFFLFDDHAAISQNPVLLNFDPGNMYDWILVARSSDSGPLGRPLTMFSFSVDTLISGQINAGAMKISNIVIHLLCALLVAWLGFLVARRVYPTEGDIQARSVGALMAILWCMAPIHVSTVLYPVQRMAQFSTLFVLLGLCLFLRCRLVWAAQGASISTVVGHSLWLCLALLFAVLAKENGVLLLWIIAFIEILLFKGVWAGRTNAVLKSSGLLVFAMPVILAALVFLLNPEWILGGYQSREFSLYQRVLTEARVLWSYVGWIALPTPGRLAFSHDYVTHSSDLFTPLTTFLSIIGWVAAFLLAYRWRTRHPWLAFGLGFFIIGHSIESSFLALELVFEHRNYLPSLGVFLIVACSIVELRRRQGDTAYLLCVTAFALLFGSVLFVRTQAWSDQFTMATFNVRHHPESPRARFFLARAYEHPVEQSQDLTRDQKIGLLSAAREQYKAMLALDPDALAPSVLLYFIDDIYFPGNPEREVWLDNIEKGSGKDKMSASDLNAMSSFFNCAESLCSLEESRGNRIIENLRKSRQFDALLLDYSWQMHNQRPELALEQLQILAQNFPGKSRISYLLLDRAVRENNIGDMYQGLVSIYRGDSSFRQLARLQSLVSE